MPVATASASSGDPTVIAAPKRGTQVANGTGKVIARSLLAVAHVVGLRRLRRPGVHAWRG